MITAPGWRRSGRPCDRASCSPAWRVERSSPASAARRGSHGSGMVSGFGWSFHFQTTHPHHISGVETKTPVSLKSSMPGATDSCSPVTFQQSRNGPFWSARPGLGGVQRFCSCPTMAASLPRLRRSCLALAPPCRWRSRLTRGALRIQRQRSSRDTHALASLWPERISWGAYK